MPSPFVQITVDTWHKAILVASMLRGFLFRGQASASWNISSSLERAAVRWSAPLSALHEIESVMIRKFQRRAHQYLEHLPEIRQYLYWLAIMQHHGAPTRLVDFTHSFFVAAFFAMEYADEESAVWAVNAEHIRRRVGEVFNIPATRDPISRNAYHLIHAAIAFSDPPPGPGVMDVEPFRQDKRIAAQQGVFLLPMAIDTSFMQNLAAGLGLEEEQLRCPEVVGFDEKIPPEPPLEAASVVKVVFDRRMHREGMMELEKMNITAGTLFPDLDGFARSLAQSVRVPEMVMQSIRSAG